MLSFIIEQVTKLRDMDLRRGRRGIADRECGGRLFEFLTAHRGQPLSGHQASYVVQKAAGVCCAGTLEGFFFLLLVAPSMSLCPCWWNRIANEAGINQEIHIRGGVGAERNTPRDASYLYIATA